MKNFILKSAAKWLIAISLAFFVLLILLSSGAFAYKIKYQNRIYPGVKIGSLDLGGKSIFNAEQEIKEIVAANVKNKIYFLYENKEIPISLTATSSEENNSSKQILTYDEKKIVKNAYSMGRDGKTTGYNFFQQIKLLFHSKNIMPIYHIDEQLLLNILKDNFSELEKKAEDAKLTIGNDFNIKIEKEHYGYVFNYPEGIKKLKKNLDKFNNVPIKIALNRTIDEPKIKMEKALPAITETEEILNFAPFKLKYQNKEWVIEKNLLKNLITLADNTGTTTASKIPDDMNTNNKGFRYIILDKAKTIDYLEKTISPEIDTKPQNAKFEIKDGKVVEFQKSTDGNQLDLKASYNHILDMIIAQKRNEVELSVKTTPSTITIDSVNEMGIKEIIGVGKSNFKGSPKNRRHNIKVGSDTLNGILIKPDEEFSLITTLGEVNGKTGYLPEMVIKGNKTLPEYGGGLCQIGTTLFRTALDTGLPITERRNHSYRVSYYEPAGTDATIYGPKPDLKFINDTHNYILIQTKIEGDIITFEFWGTKDGRKVEKTEPKIYNIKKAGPAKIIETEDLKPGEKKCTERAHNGADAEFNYKVTYQDGEIKEKIFKSHYIVWSAVCLVGKEKNSDSATSTPEKLNQ